MLDAWSRRGTRRAGIPDLVAVTRQPGYHAVSQDPLATGAAERYDVRDAPAGEERRDRVGYRRGHPTLGYDRGLSQGVIVSIRQNGPAARVSLRSPVSRVTWSASARATYAAS